MMNSEQHLLPVADAIQAVIGRRVHRNTFSRWRRSGELSCVRIGGRWCTSPKDVRKMIDQQTANAKASETSPA